MIQAIHSNQLYSETTIFSQGIVADEFTFWLQTLAGRMVRSEDRSAKARSAVKRLKLCASRSIPAARIYRTW